MIQNASLVLRCTLTNMRVSRRQFSMLTPGVSTVVAIPGDSRSDVRSHRIGRQAMKAVRMMQ